MPLTLAALGRCADLMPHNPLGPVSTAACIHLGAAVPNFAYLEDNFSEENMHSQ
jgi:galactonate dehydratase